MALSPDLNWIWIHCQLKYQRFGSRSEKRTWPHISTLRSTNREMLMWFRLCSWYSKMSIWSKLYRLIKYTILICNYFRSRFASHTHGSWSRPTFLLSKNSSQTCFFLDWRLWIVRYPSTLPSSSQGLSGHAWCYWQSLIYELATT